MGDDIEDAEDGHRIESVCFTNSLFGFFPILICLCGFTTSGRCSNWTDAAEEYDAHLEARKNE